MKRTISKNQFIDIMTRTSAFSYDGSEALYEALCELEDESGIEIELDPIALRGEFHEVYTEEITLESVLCYFTACHYEFGPGSSHYYERKAIVYAS